jgi:hypothetical protein
MFYIIQNNLFSKIEIIITTSIYIEYVLGGVLGNVLCVVLGHVLVAYSSTSPSTKHNRSIILPLLDYKTFPATHEKKKTRNHINLYMDRWIGFVLPCLVCLSKREEKQQ